MAVTFRCDCGRQLSAPESFGGTRAICPSCGRTLTIPATSAAQPATTVGGPPPPLPAGFEVVDEFLDPPASAPRPPARPALERMLEALLDPRSIQYLLLFGGGLAVLGLIVWLVSLGLFEDPTVVAVALAAGTLALLGAGWWVSLRTRFRTAGQALTFLACVVAPLNLWFYHAQGLVTLEGHLWAGGVACTLLFAATVYALRDPLFLYAVEAGITLTALLFLAHFGRAGDAAPLSLCLMALGLASLHAERAFPPGESLFNRRRFGLPLFWSGQAQVGASLLVLLAVQLLVWLLGPSAAVLGYRVGGTPLTEHTLLAGGLWLAGTYAYLYSDLVVRRVGVYMLLAAFCLVMAEVTLLAGRLPAEGLIAILAVTALAVNLLPLLLRGDARRVGRAVPQLALGLSALPVLLGIGLHLRATSARAAELGWGYRTGWGFVGAMLLVVAVNRFAAWAYRRHGSLAAPPETAAEAELGTPAHRRAVFPWSAVYFFFSAAGLVVAAAGLLRVLGLEAWSAHAPLLMLIPLGYLVAARLWRGHSPERPLYWVAHAATAVILLHGLLAAVQFLGPERLLRAARDPAENLRLALVFAEATLFYGLAAWLRRRGVNVYPAAAAACGTLWQLLVYWGVEGPYTTMLYAVLGLALLAVGRVLGVEPHAVYGRDGEKGTALRGRGRTAFQSGNAILWVALLAAFLQGGIRLLTRGSGWEELAALALTAGTSLVAVVLAPAGAWRRLYVVSTIALAGLTFLTLNVLVDLSGWQKLEIFCVTAGVVLLAVSYVGLFREPEGRAGDGVTTGLNLGSLLAALPLLIAVLEHRFVRGQVSLWDELALVTVTILMVATGIAWRVRASTLVGGGTLGLYLVVLIARLAYHPQVYVGVYLAAGGLAVFGLGLALSYYRERLLKLPERIAQREGVFRVFGWR